MTTEAIHVSHRKNNSSSAAKPQSSKTSADTPRAVRGSASGGKLLRPDNDDAKAFGEAITYLEKQERKALQGNKFQTYQCNDKTGVWDVAFYDNRRTRLTKKFAGLKTRLQNLVKPGSVTANYGALTLTGAARVGVSATKLASQGGLVSNAGPALAGAGGVVAAAGVAAAVVNGVAAYQNIHALNTKKRTSIIEGLQYKDLAEEHVKNPSMKTAEAYRKFMAAAAGFRQKNLARKPGSNPFKKINDSIAAKSDLKREGERLRWVAARDGVNTASSVISTVSPFVSAVSPAGAALAVLAAPCDIGAGAAFVADGKSQIASVKSERVRLDQWREQAEFESDQPVLPRTAMHESVDAELKRKRRTARWTKNAGILQITKGSLNLAIGIPATVLLSVAVATGVAGAVLTGGIALLVAVAVVGTVAAAGVVGRNLQKRSALRHDHKRQRQAQAVIATHSPDALKEMLSDPQKRRTISVPTRERRPFQLFGKGELRYRSTDPVSNGYVALHVMAVEVAQALDPVGKPDAYEARDSNAIGELAQFLQTRGMSAFDVEALVLAAQAQAPEARLMYLKKALATCMGLNFRTEANGAESPLIPEVLLNEFSKRASWNIAVTDNQQVVSKLTAKQAASISADLFRNVNFYDFEAAVEEQQQKTESEPEAAGLLKWESQRRRQQLLEIASIENPSANVAQILANHLAVTPDTAQEFLGFARKHAYHLQSRGDALADMKKSPPPAAFVKAWRLAQASNSLPDAPWVATVSDLIRHAPAS